MLRNASMWEAMAKRTGNAILLAYFLVIWSVLTFVGSTIISLEDFNRSDPVILNHLVIDHDSNDLYIGAKNRLYRLSSDLTLRNLEYTGPKNDSQRCNLNAINDPSKCSAPKQLTDNYNKILLVDKYYGQRRILTCGNLFQGKCESRDYITLKEQETFPIAVATNDPDANSVAFFATVRPALASSPEITIYTASDFFQHKKAKEDLAYLIRKDQVKAIGVRKVNPVSETFKLINDMSFLKYQSSYLEGANILTFVTGFVSGKYRYLVMVEKGEFSNKTFIVHMCEEDDKFNCFVEIPLQCRSNSSSFTTATSARVIAPSQKLKNIIGLDDGDEVVVVTFKNGEKLASSAVCVYSMKFIQKVVVQNVKGCHSKNEDFAQNKFDEGNLCDNLIPTDDIISNQTNSNVQVTSDEELLCPQILRERISGVIPAENQAVAVFHDTELTSIALTTTTDFTVAFLGTAQGAIRKLVLESNKTGTVYGGTTVVDSGSAIRQDMMFDRDAEFIYAMSETKVAKIKAHNCQQYTTCSACLTSKDPHCGWCTLENKCVLKNQCTNPTISRWKKYGRGQEDCIVIMDISPPMASVEMPSLVLYLTVMDLPKDSNYSCEFNFGAITESTPATFWYGGLGCDTPPQKKLGMGHKNISLGVRSKETDKLVVTTSYTFYECSEFTSCTSCVDNKYWCDWCVTENKCTYEPLQANCMGDIIYSRNDTYIDDSNQTEYRNGKNGRNGPLHCPRIDLSATGSIFIPNGQGKSITVKGHNLPLPYAGGEYKATIASQNQGQIIVTGRMINKTDLIFPIPKLQGTLINGLHNASMTISWGNNYQLNSNGLHLSLYSCPELANGDCSYCKSLGYSFPQLHCYWCNSDCVFDERSQCVREECPGPQLTSVQPLSGHYLGGTHVIITGTNMGSTFEDIDHNVSIANIACKPIRHLYVPSKQIVCIIGASSGEYSGRIKILKRIMPNFVFYYRKPKVSFIRPALKAQSGGGHITLHGVYLNTGNNITVSVNGSACENVIRYNTSSVGCTVPRSSGTGLAPVNVAIDGKVVQPENLSFTYVTDPTIEDMEPMQSFYSGGRQLTIQGTNLQAVDTPKIFASVNNGGSIKDTDKFSCTIHNNTVMFCPSPKIKESMKQRPSAVNLIRLKRATAILSAKIGFIMDDVQSVRNLPDDFSLQYYQDPVITKFEDEKGASNIKQKGDVLIISGDGLTLGASKSDVRVFVGAGQCNVTNLSEDKIYCDPPLKKPPVREDGLQRSDGTPRVIVVIGNRNWTVGYLQYDQPSEADLMIFILLGVAGCVLVIMIIVVFTCVWFRRQRNKAKREMKKIQIQLDNMESNVRNECKQAFAELQTDMTDLTKELDSGKKPFYSYDDYTFKVLFPGNLDHVILHPPQQRNGNIDRHPDIAIMHFNTLLHNKHFLLMFIRTLERQKSFSIRDKSNVASLLIILFQNNMEYVTEILKCLLHDLIDKSIESKHPKLMLRRTESVVEKLLANWLSLCLYKHLIDSSGSSLYTLYQAIKVQVDKGPVDHLTGDARYSLSEDRLLRTEIKLEPVQLTLNVEYDGRKTKCRVLNCDTITQAKEKMLDTMFRNFPYSQRPSALDLDLEWIQCSKTLSDEDSSTQKVDGWKQLNTLKHYSVIDGADMVLTQHQNCRTLPRSPNGSVHSSGFQFNKEAVPITRTESEMGYRFWHLVKQDDNQTSNGGIKLSSEIYLTRLLSTKGTLKKYIDDFFQTLLTANSSMPPVIKYLFDFLDDAAKKSSLTIDPDVVHTWKCNSLLLRFWVNIIKNPDFLYDINKPNIIDSCLSVVAQTFMDSCSTSDHQLNPDSPTNKLLFAKDIPHYKQLVEKYFQDIKSLPTVSDQDLNAYLADVSRMCTGTFTRENALHELYNYVHEYTNAINESLEADSFSSAQQLQIKLGHVITSMEGPSSQTDYV